MLASGVAFRYDAAPIGAVHRTPQGGIRVPATLTRTGIFEYLNPDGTTRREYRAPEEVFSEESLATLRGAPVTNLHPAGDRVDAETWRSKAVGHAGEDARKADDGIHIAATVYVQDAATIALVESGERQEISLGYDQDYVAEPGVSPSGERYDGRQTRIRYNHVALVPRGRAGSARLRLDGSEEPGDAPVKIKIGGKDYEVGTPEAEAALADVQRRADAAEAALRTLRLDGLRKAAAAKGVQVRADADEASIMLSVIAKVLPGLSAEGKSPEWIMGAFEAALAMALPSEPEEPVADEEEEAPADPNAPKAPPTAPDVRADVFEARRAPVKSVSRSDADLPPDVIARRRMIAAGSSLK